MPTPDEIVSQMRQSLSLVEPDLDTSTGTPIRKILDVVSESIAEAYVDRYLLSYQYDIDSKSGADLDSFVALFGFSRQMARRATGTVILQRDTAATSAFVIPNGTQFSTADANPIVVQIVSSTVFPVGATSITVTVQAIVGGAAGNVSANNITRSITQISGVMSLTNPSALTGGMDAENDNQLRERFKRTIFRGLAGTKDMYTALALDDVAVTSSKVLGPSERWREQIQIVSGTATSTITNNTAKFTVTAATNASPAVVTVSQVHNLFVGDIIKIASVGGNTAVNGVFRIRTVPSTTTFTLTSLDGTTAIAGNGAYTSGGTVTIIDRVKWIYPTGYAMGTNLSTGNVLTPGIHYTFDSTTIPPTVTSLDSTACPDGVYDLSFNYVPIASRNDPPQGITNRVDVEINGQNLQTANETMVVDGRTTVSASLGNTTSYNRFKRPDGSYPTSGNIITRLGFCPLNDLPDALSIGTQSLVYGTDYWMLREQGTTAGSWDSYDGIEFNASTVQAGSVSISSSTNASPIVVSVSSHKFFVGQRVYITGHTTNTAANGYWTISATGSTTITLSGSVGNGIGGATGTISLVSPVPIEYTYNSSPRDVQSSIENWRLLTTDVAVHYGFPVNLKINAAVILKPGNTLSSIDTPMSNAVSNLLSQLPMGGTLQISDLLNVMGDVSGVDAVRLLNSGDLTSLSVSGATNASPIVLTVPSGHGYVANDLIVVSGVVGNTAANGTFVVQSVGTTTITLKNSTGNGAYSSGGTIVKGSFAIARMEDDAVTPRTLYATSTAPYRASDIQIADNEFFALHSIALTLKAANSWGTY